MSNPHPSTTTLKPQTTNPTPYTVNPQPEMEPTVGEGVVQGVGIVVGGRGTPVARDT